MRKLTVCVSGGFDPVHFGHIKLFKEAKSLGDKLVVILNNDNWLMSKKGYVFMSQDERVEIIKSIRYVDDVVITSHVLKDSDMSVCRELRKVIPDIFANGGDRWKGNVPERVCCENLGVKMVDNVGGLKANSSSDLVSKALKNVKF